MVMPKLFPTVATKRRIIAFAGCARTVAPNATSEDKGRRVAPANAAKNSRVKVANNGKDGTLIYSE